MADTTHVITDGMTYMFDLSAAISDPPQHHPAIYWLDAAYCLEHRLDAIEAKYASIDIRNEARVRLAHLAERTTRDMGWAVCTHTEEERQPDPYTPVLRWVLYECPVYDRIVAMQGQHGMYALRVLDANQKIAALPLRRLHYYGTQAYGALYDGVLYVMCSLVPVVPEAGCAKPS